MARLASTDERGRRAEDIASWYFRLNGFLAISGFIVHPDQRRQFARTEAVSWACGFRSVKS